MDFDTVDTTPERLRHVRRATDDKLETEARLWEARVRQIYQDRRSGSWFSRLLRRWGRLIGYTGAFLFGLVFWGAVYRFLHA